MKNSNCSPRTSPKGRKLPMLPRFTENTFNVYSPSAGKGVLDLQTAARAERQTRDVIVLRRVLGNPIGYLRGCCCRTHRDAAHPRGGREVGFEESRRERQRSGLVVEAAARIVGRQELGRVDLQAEQIAHRVRILRAVEAMQLRLVQVGLGVTVDLGFQRAGKCLDGRRNRAAVCPPVASCRRAACCSIRSASFASS